MDISSLDCNGLNTTNFDMEILASMTNTDLLIRLIKDHADETALLKSQLSSINASAMQMKNCFTAEKKKNDHIENENRQLQLRMKDLEQEISLLNSNSLNNAVLQEQKLAEMENQLADKVVICRQLIKQGNILKENHLSSRELHQHYINAKEYLRRRGEVVEDAKVGSKKKKPAKVNAATMTDQCDKVEPKEVKTFCDKSTMHSPMVSTATRGTTTSAFIKKVNVATNFPEPLSIEVEEIFRIMIDDMPPAVTPIDDLPSKTKYSQTEPAMQSNCSVGTITRIRNVRRKINYSSDHSQPSPASKQLYRVKKEKEDSMSDLEYPDQRGNSPINQKLTHLWQMVGQMIFAIIGNGEVFNHSNSDMNVINDNLNQIRRVIEMESQPEARFRHDDELIEEPSDEDFSLANDVSGFSAPYATSHKNATITSNSVNEGNASSSTPNLPHFEPATNAEMATKSSQICPTESTSPRTRIQHNSSNDVPFSVDSSVQCETESVFKKPTVGTKRKLLTEDCTVRKRTCRTKMAIKSKASLLDKPKKKESHQRNDRNEESTATIDEPDSMLVEAILRYYKMPKFIEPIADSVFTAESGERLSKDELSANSHLDSGRMSSDLFSFDLMSTTNSESKELSFTDSASTDFTSTGSSSTDSGSRTLITYEELESPASPPPFTYSDAPYQAPLIIPTSPKKCSTSVLKDILANFDLPKRLALRQRKFKLPTVQEEQILTSTRCRIEKYVMSEWTDREIDGCYNDLANVRPSILSKCIIEVVINTKNVNLSREFTPPAPALPETHQKIIVLIKRIGRHVNAFEDLVLFQLEKVMFVLAGEKVSIAEGLNLTHLFIGLTDCMDGASRWSCVLFVFKCLYYFAIKAIPMVYSVLMAYPTILPKFEEGEDTAEFLMNSTNTLQATLAVILINTNLCESDTADANNGLNKRNLSTFLKKFYHLPCMKPTIDDFVDNLLHRLASSSNLENISYSLILIAKRKGVVWADEMVQRKLLPMLNDFLLNVSDGTANDERIAILVSAISSIIKTYPITDDISNYQQIFFKILDSTTRQTIQEEAVMALLRTSRFGMVDVYKRICDWQPSTAVSRQCYSMLSTFLYRQNLNYWQQF